MKKKFSKDVLLNISTMKFVRSFDFTPCVKFRGSTPKNLFELTVPLCKISRTDSSFSIVSIGLFGGVKRIYLNDIDFETAMDVIEFPERKHEFFNPLNLFKRG